MQNVIIFDNILWTQFLCVSLSTCKPVHNTTRVHYKKITSAKNRIAASLTSTARFPYIHNCSKYFLKQTLVNKLITRSLNSSFRQERRPLSALPWYLRSINIWCCHTASGTKLLVLFFFLLVSLLIYSWVPQILWKLPLLIWLKRPWRHVRLWSLFGRRLCLCSPSYRRETETRSFRAPADTLTSQSMELPQEAKGGWDIGPVRSHRCSWIHCCVRLCLK